MPNIQKNGDFLLKTTRIEGSSTKPRKPRGNSICDFEQYRVLLDEWHPGNYWGPECFGPASNYEVQWICRKTGIEHLFWASISWRTGAINNDQEHQGCIICSPRESYGPPEPLDEHLAKQWLSRINGVSSKNLSSRSSKLGLWKCDSENCAHQWRTKVTSRTSKDSQHCPACFARHYPQGTVNLNRIVNKRAEEFFDMEHPRRNAGYDKSKLPRSYKVFWTCSNQRHRWYESYESLKERHWLCPKCSLTINDFPQLKKEFDSYLNDRRKTKEITIEKNTRLRLTWRCSKDKEHVWRARLSDRVQKKSGCPFCAGRKLSSSNSLIECFPALAAEIHPELNQSIEVSSLTANSTKKIFWLAKCGHVWQAQVRLRTKRGYGCPKCKRQKQQKNK